MHRGSRDALPSLDLDNYKVGPFIKKVELEPNARRGNFDPFTYNRSI